MSWCVISLFFRPQKYLQPHQRLVSTLLAIAATAAHELVPPQELIPVVKHIADVFINETRGEEIVTVGLNAVRGLGLQNTSQDCGNLKRLLRLHARAPIPSCRAPRLSTVRQ